MPRSANVTDQVAKVLRPLLTYLVVLRPTEAAEDKRNMTDQRENLPPLAMRVDDFRRQMGGISRSHFYELVARNEIRVIKLGCRTLVPTSEAERLLAGLEKNKRRRPAPGKAIAASGPA